MSYLKKKQKNDESFWLDVQDEIAKLDEVNSSELQDFGFEGDAGEGSRDILFYFELEDQSETVALNMRHAWGGNTDGTYNKPSQQWIMDYYPSGDNIDSSLYRVEVQDSPKKEAKNILEQVLDNIWSSVK